MRYENTFVREVKEKNITEPSEILNWYRNLYHTEDNHTEHGIVAYAINDFFADVVPKSEVERLNAENETLKDNNEHLAVILEETKIELKAMRGAANSLKMHYEEAEAEIERLKHILDCYALQYGTVKEQQDVIDKANQEFAREIFAEIESAKVSIGDFKIKTFKIISLGKVAEQTITGDVVAFSDIAELKKKYTEGEE